MIVTEDPIKLAGIRDWPTPMTVKQVRSFLGFGNYYRKFISGFAHLARPLHELTKKNKIWTWTVECQIAFDLLKERFVTITVWTPALCLLDMSDKSFSLCLPYSSLTLCLIHMDNLISLLIPFLVHYLVLHMIPSLFTNMVVPCSLIRTSLCTYMYINPCT